MKAIKDEIRLIDAYKEYLKRYKEYKEILSKKIFGRKKYEKDNTDLVERYREIYNKLDMPLMSVMDYVKYIGMG